MTEMIETIDINASNKNDRPISRELRLEFDNLMPNNPSLPGKSSQLAIISHEPHLFSKSRGQVMEFDSVEQLIYQASKDHAYGILEIKQQKLEIPAWEVTMRKGQYDATESLVIPYDKAAEILDLPEFEEWKNGGKSNRGIVKTPFYEEIQEHAAFLKRAENFRGCAYPDGYEPEDTFIRTFTDLTFTGDPTMSLDREDTDWLEHTDLGDKIEAAAESALAADSSLYDKKEYQKFCKSLADHIPIPHAEEVLTQTFQKLADKEKNATAESIAADTMTNLLEKLKEKGFSAKDISKAIEKSSKKAIKEVNNEKGRA